MNNVMNILKGVHQRAEVEDNHSAYTISTDNANIVFVIRKCVQCDV